MSDTVERKAGRSVRVELIDERDLVIEKVGYGCGSRSFDEVPNLLRVVLGDEAAAAGFGDESAVVLEANLDDLAPQVLGHVLPRLLASGAFDARANGSDRRERTGTGRPPGTGD